MTSVMYDNKNIKSIIRKVCNDCKVEINIYPNGERSEGYSFIVTGALYSQVVDKLIQSINEAYPENKQLSAWRIDNGKNQCPCPGVDKGYEEKCIELRLM